MKADGPRRPRPRRKPAARPSPSARGDGALAAADPLKLALPPLGWPALADEVYAEADLLFPSGDDVLREVLNEAAGALGPGSRALLLGDETARAACYLAKQAGLFCAVAGRHEPLLARARRRVEAAGLADRISFNKADIAALPARLGKGRWDLVLCEGALHAAGLARGVRAARSLLAPGGVLAFSMIAFTAPPAPAHQRFWDTVLAPHAPGTADDVMVLLGEERFGGGVAWALGRAHWERYHAPLRAAVERLRARGARGPLLDRLERELRVVHDEGGHASAGPVCFVAQLQE